MTTCTIKIGTAAILLVVATCCGAPEASAQLFMNFSQPQRSPGITDNLGLGGPGSAIQMQNEPVIGSSRGLGLPLLDPQAGKSLGVNGNPVATTQGSLSSAGDRSSSPADSVTNTLTGSVGILASPPANSPANPAANPSAKRKQTKNAAATSSGSRGAAPQVSSAKAP